MKSLIVCLLLVAIVVAQAAPLEDFQDVEPLEVEAMEVAKRGGPFLATCLKPGTRIQCFCLYDDEGNIRSWMKCN